MFIGTNQNGLIITIDISELLEFDNLIDPEEARKTDVNNTTYAIDESKYEEEKEAEYEPPERPNGRFGPSENITEFDKLQQQQKYIMGQK